MQSEESIRIKVGPTVITGTWLPVVDAKGVILIALSSSSGRWSLRNRYPADVCRRNGFDVLLLDLLDSAEDRKAACRLDARLLQTRLSEGVNWITRRDSVADLPIGLLVANTAAAAALLLAADSHSRIRAIVARSARPNLASSVLSVVKCPTFLIVASGEHPTIVEANQRAYRELQCVKKLSIVPSASRLFTEGDALQEMAVLAADWFRRHMVANGDQDFETDPVQAAG